MARVRNPRGDGARLREELLRAADALLDETGDPASVTIRGVAARVGVAPTAVYLHFRDRTALLGETAIDRFAAFGDRIEAAIRAAGDDPVAALRAGHVAYITFALEHPAHYRLLFGDELHLEGDLADRFAEVGLRAFSLCVESCRRLLDTGLVHGVGANDLALLVWTAEHGYATLAGGTKGAILGPPHAGIDTLLTALGVPVGPTAAVPRPEG